jgi:hypothetical protein
MTLKSTTLGLFASLLGLTMILAAVGLLGAHRNAPMTTDAVSSASSSLAAAGASR